MPFYKISAPEVVAGVSGESEQKIRLFFKTAMAQAPCIMFIDEIDAIAGKVYARVCPCLYLITWFFQFVEVIPISHLFSPSLHFCLISVIGIRGLR